MMQPQALKYFAEVARSGSLRQASDVFDIVPSAISRQIALLEQHLGVVLFERSTRGMALTESGLVLLEYVRDTEHRVGSLQRRLDDLSELRHGTVRLAVVEAATDDFLPRTLAGFSATYPQIEFQVSVCGTSDIADRLVTNSAEIALTFNSPSRDDLLLRASIPEPLQLICAPTNALNTGVPLTMKQLDGVAVALPYRSFGIRRLVDQAESAAHIHLRIALETDSLQLIKNVVASSDLVSFMPPMTFARELATGALSAVQVQEATFSRATIDVITARGHDLSHAARRFLSFLIQRAQLRG